MRKNKRAKMKTNKYIHHILKILDDICYMEKIKLEEKLDETIEDFSLRFFKDVMSFLVKEKIIEKKPFLLDLRKWLYKKNVCYYFIE